MEKTAMWWWRDLVDEMVNKENSRLQKILRVLQDKWCGIEKNHKRPQAYLSKSRPGLYFTPRETEILHCLSKKMKFAEIAEIFRISYSGVDYHVTRIRQKLGDCPTAKSISKHPAVIEFLKKSSFEKQRYSNRNRIK